MRIVTGFTALAALVLAGATWACGSSGSSPGGGPGGGDSLDRLAAVRDAMCACGDAACARAQQAAYRAWKQETARDPRPGPERARRFLALREALVACHDRLVAAGAGAGPAGAPPVDVGSAGSAGSAGARAPAGP